MSESWERRRRKRWFDIFNDVDRFLEDRMKKAFRSEPHLTVKRLTPFVYGYSITINPDHKPVIKQFCNFR